MNKQIDAIGWKWSDDIRGSRTIQADGGLYTNTGAVNCGAVSAMSKYPLAAVYNETTGIALAIDMGKAAVYRLSYHPGLKALVITYDLGLARDTARFPSSADFAFVIYRFDPKWGFRAAYRKLSGTSPEYFTVRSKEQGIWMPFTDVSSVQGWRDFGFKYHEGDNNLAFDAANGILAFAAATRVWHGHPGRDRFTGWKPVPRESSRPAKKLGNSRTEVFFFVSSVPLW